MKKLCRKTYIFKQSSVPTELKALAAMECLTIPETIEKIMRFYKTTRKIDELQKSKKGAEVEND